jgi:hypothetical protein
LSGPPHSLHTTARMGAPLQESGYCKWIARQVLAQTAKSLPCGRLFG